ncbi:MAG: Rieske 2Fe-2S domain-containing protein, partial [Anaerolineae bacterium]|nr:Rieske 2Fe-2S domain-containing protein [Anaerolineae bacterium]
MKPIDLDSLGEPLSLSGFSPTDDLAKAETMPASWYTDPRMLELEKERIFYKTWQPIGRVDLVRRPGDFFTCEVVGQPLVISRGLDNKLRAFYNVCMHRAGP